MRIEPLIALLISCTLLAAPANGQHTGDVLIGVQDNKITTGIIEGGVPHFPWRVWEEDFGEIVPNMTDDPGYDSHAGTFPPNTPVGLRIRKALRVWNETEEHFQDIAEPEWLRISRFSLSIDSPEFDPGHCGALPSIQLGTANSQGGLHAHAWYELAAPNGMPSNGVYLVELEVWAGGGIAPSEPFWIVFNQNRPHEIVDEAVDWVEMHLVDADACPADMNGDGVVDVLDMLALFSAWGACPSGGACAADLNGDCAVDVLDMLMLFSAWGACP